MLASVASMIDQFNMHNIRMLLKMGYEVSVACNFYVGNTCDTTQMKKLLKTLRDMHVPYYQWDCPRSIVPVGKCFCAYRQLMKLTRRHSFGWIHCHSPVGSAIARLVAHKRKIRVIYTAHGFHFYKGAPKKNWMLYYPAEKLLSAWTDVLVTVNQEDYRFARRNLRIKDIYRISGVGIDTERFEMKVIKKCSLRRKYDIPDDAILLLSVGELSRRKNHQAVLDAMALLSRSDIYYLVCGLGQCEKELQKRAKELGIGERFRLAGYQEDVSEYYQNADIFVFPSKQEGLPVALMEAMAAGLPCIVSDIRGNRELIDTDFAQADRIKDGMHGGIRFSLKYPEQLSVALARMAENEILRRMCGRYNREKIKGYDRKVVDRQMHGIYKKSMTKYVMEGDKYAGNIGNYVGL